QEDIGGAVAAAPTVARPLPLHRRVDDGVGATDQGAGRGLIAQLAWQPLHGIGVLVEAAAVSGRPVPAAELMPRVRAAAHHVAAQESGGPGDGDPHAWLPARMGCPVLSSRCYSPARGSGAGGVIAPASRRIASASAAAPSAPAAAAR